MPTPRTTLALAGVMLVILLCSISLTAADTDTTTDKTLASLEIRQPDRIITGCEYIIDLSPDGQTAFVMQSYMTNDAWQLLILSWRYWGAIPPAISILFAFFLIYRLRRRVRQDAEPFCRKCNYQLTGNITGQCPECGTILNNQTVRLGPPLHRKIILVLLAAMILPALYAACYWPDFEKKIQKKYLYKYEWNSQIAYKLNKSLKYSYLHRNETCSYFARSFDLSEQKLGPEILMAAWPPMHHIGFTGFRAAPSPDGKFMALTKGTETVLWDNAKQIIHQRITSTGNALLGPGTTPLPKTFWGRIFRVDWGHDGRVYTVGDDSYDCWDFNVGTISQINNPVPSNITSLMNQQIGPWQGNPLFSTLDFTVHFNKNNKTLDFWDYDNKTLLQQINLPDNFIPGDVHLSNNQLYLAIWSEFANKDNANQLIIILFDYKTCEPVDSFSVILPQYTALEFNRYYIGGLQTIHIADDGMVSLILSPYVDGKTLLRSSVMQFNKLN